jgi:hypothetical protein
MAQLCFLISIDFEIASASLASDRKNFLSSFNQLLELDLLFAACTADFFSYERQPTQPFVDRVKYRERQIRKIENAFKKVAALCE